MTDIQPDNKLKRLTHVWQCSFCMHFDPDPDLLKEHIREEHGIDPDTWGQEQKPGHQHAWRFLRQQENGLDVFFCESCLEYRTGSAA